MEKEAEWEGEGGWGVELVTGWRENERRKKVEGVEGKERGVHSWVIQHGRPG